MKLWERGKALLQGKTSCAWECFWVLGRDPMHSKVLTMDPAQGSWCSALFRDHYLHVVGRHSPTFGGSDCLDVGCGEPRLIPDHEPFQETRRSSRAVNPFCSAQVRQVRDRSELREIIFRDKDKGLWKTITLGAPSSETSFISKVLSSSTTHLFQDICAPMVAVLLSLSVLSILRMANPPAWNSVLPDWYYPTPLTSQKLMQHLFLKAN